MVSLGDLPGGDVRGAAVDVSGDGSVVVGNSDSAAGREAFIWDEAHGMRSLKTVLAEEYGLDLSGWELERAEAISDDGMTIVGEGVNPLGLDEVWVVTLPEPSMTTVLMVGAVLAAGRMRRSRIRTFLRMASVASGGKCPRGEVQILRDFLLTGLRGGVVQTPLRARMSVGYGDLCWVSSTGITPGPSAERNGRMLFRIRVRPHRGACGACGACGRPGGPDGSV